MQSTVRSKAPDCPAEWVQHSSWHLSSGRSGKWGGGEDREFEKMQLFPLTSSPDPQQQYHLGFRGQNFVSQGTHHTTHTPTRELLVILLGPHTEVEKSWPYS